MQGLAAAARLGGGLSSSSHSALSARVQQPPRCAIAARSRRARASGARADGRDSGNGHIHNKLEHSSSPLGPDGEAGGSNMDYVLECLKLIEQREQELSLMRKELLSRMKQSARALGARSPEDGLGSELESLERAYASPFGPDAYDAFLPGPDSKVDATDCTVSHPGALCCTRTTVAQDERQKTAVISLRTTIKLNGVSASGSALSLDALVALGAQSLAAHATELCTKQVQSAAELPGDANDRHTFYVNILSQGKIVHAESWSAANGFGHPSYKVTLQHPTTKDEVTALFKPKIEGDGDGWHRPSMEWVAYELNTLLGMDLVPPVAYRRGGVDVDYQHFKEGAFILWVNKAEELKNVPQERWGVSQEKLLSDTRILDVLLHNSDRHHGHFLHAQHWSLNGEKHPVLIDHAASFRKEAFVSMDHENAFRTGPVRTVSAKTYLRLRFFDARAIAARFAPVLTAGELRELLQRRNAILEYLDHLVQTVGHSKVVIE